MSGCLLITDDFAIVITEGARKAQKRYAHLLLNRINWNPAAEDDEGADDSKCVITQFSETTFNLLNNNFFYWVPSV